MLNQKTVSTYVYLIYVMLTDTKPKRQYLNVNLDRFLILNIPYLTFAVKLVTYWIFKTLDIRNLIFRYW